MPAAMKRKMTYGEECDLKEIFVAHWAYIAEAYSRGLPTGMYDREQAACVEAIRKAEMLDGDLRLDPTWRKAVDEVSGGRSIYDLSEADKKLIVEAWVRLAGRC